MINELLRRRKMLNEICEEQWRFNQIFTSKSTNGFNSTLPVEVAELTTLKMPNIIAHDFSGYTIRLGSEKHDFNTLATIHI